MANYFLGTDDNLLIERRATPRYGAELDIEVSFPTSGAPIRGVTRDISESGAQVVLPTAVPAGEAVDFKFATFAGSAQVVWSRGEGSHARVGLRFVSLSPKDRGALLEVIDDLKRGLRARLKAARE